MPKTALVKTDMSANTDDLTEMQAAFVMGFTSEPGSIGNASEAARRAGYSAASATEIGRQLLGKPHIRAAIDAANRSAISGRLATKGIALLERVIDDEGAPLKVRVQAALGLLDRGGYGSPTATEQAAAAAARAIGASKRLLTEMAPEELDAALARALAAHNVGPENAKVIEGVVVEPDEGSL
jgi:phage terminase small subunit